jgi:1-acyl-sn-glycerol-3-phosphate acyltransferase/DNA-directed RNA polymerase subunit RPC12/RpoP
MLILGGWIKHEFYDEHAMERPNPFLYHLVVPFVTLAASFFARISRRNCECPARSRPVLVLGSHTCFFDFYFAAKALYPRRMTFVVNRFYFEAHIVRWLMRHLGCIPKRLFTPDLETAKKLMAAKREGCSVVLFPEGRLSASGTSFPLVGDTIALVRHMGMDVYEYHTVGGYFCKPKWGIGLRKTPVDIHLHKIVSAEELEGITDEVLEAKISAALSYDECRRYISLRKPDRRANVRGLERMLFRCPLCGAEFVGKTEKNRLICTTCGHATVFDKNYCADGKTISELHAEQMEYLKTLKDYCFEQKTTIHRFDKRRGVMTERGEGICRLTEGAIVYEGTEDGKEVRYEKTPAELQALIYTEGKHFQFYEGKELCFFYPEDRNVCAKWSMLWDIQRERVMQIEKLRSARRDLEKAESELLPAKQ